MKLNRNLNNQEIAKLLKAISAAFEVKNGNLFKIAAYDRAAVAVEHSTSEMKDLWDDGKLEDVPGIGKSIAAHLDELFRTGRIKHFEKVMKGLPPAMFQLINVPGVGPKTAYKLCKHLHIVREKDAFLKLKVAARTGKIRKIEGFGQESEKDILEGLASLDRREGRMLLPVAMELAQKVIKYLEAGEKIGLKIDPLGSLRRMAATVGDIDLAVATHDPKAALDKFLKFPETKKIVASGSNTARIIHRSGRQIDLKTMDPNAYGALLQHFTGSKQHNIHLREIAQKKNLSLSEYGIKRRIQNSKFKIQNYRTEEEFYKALGMEWIPPELREDTGELEAAQRGKLPQLIELTEIKGDLHTHSNFPIEESHDPGMDSMEKMIRVASDLRYEYLGFAEHNPSQSQHSEKEIINLIRSKKEAIDHLNYSRVNKLLKGVLNGLEVDIKPSGEIALPEKAINLLDYLIVSIHSSFGFDRGQMTKRVLRALSYPKVKIFSDFACT